MAQFIKLLSNRISKHLSIGARKKSELNSFEQIQNIFSILSSICCSEFEHDNFLQNKLKLIPLIDISTESFNHEDIYDLSTEEVTIKKMEDSKKQYLDSPF